MVDRDKIIRAWERCQKDTCPTLFSQEYFDCEYTMGLYCRKDKLIKDTIELLKEEKAAEKNASVLKEQRTKIQLVCPSCQRKIECCISVEND